MELEELLKKFKEMDYELMEFEPFQEELFNRGLQIWVKDSKLIFTKEYEAKSLFYDWLIYEQPIIASIYSYLPAKYQKNMYFFMILNFDLNNDDDMALAINKVVKNEYVCKKYVFQSIEEITDVPFMSSNNFKKNKFDYDQQFKSDILSSPVIDKLAAQKEVDQRSFKRLASDLLDYYFSSYSTTEESDEIEGNIMKIGRGNWKDEN